jgi:two-component system NtrC family response regulator
VYVPSVEPVKEANVTKPGVLIVDDDVEIREQLQWALKDTYTVHLAGTAREALTCAKRHRPALVSLDLGLPPRPLTQLEKWRLEAQQEQAESANRAAA